MLRWKSQPAFWRKLRDLILQLSWISKPDSKEPSLAFAGLLVTYSKDTVAVTSLHGYCNATTGNGTDAHKSYQESKTVTHAPYVPVIGIFGMTENITGVIITDTGDWFFANKLTKAALFFVPNTVPKTEIQ